MSRWIFLLLLLSIGCTSATTGVSSAAEERKKATKRSLGESQVGRRLSFTSKRCGETGIYSAKVTIQVIVVGSSGNLNCIISITEKYLAASDIDAGYVCVSAFTAKPAVFVSKDDPRVLRVRRYAENLAKAEAYSAERGIPLEIVYITTSRGSPHPEPRCKKILGSAGS